MTQKLKLGTVVPWAVTHNSIVQNFDICLCSRNMRLTLPQIQKTVEFGVKLTSYFENKVKYQNSVQQLCQVSASECGQYSQLTTMGLLTFYSLS